MSMIAEPEVFRFLAGRPLNEKEAWSRLLMYMGHWSAYGYGFFAVFDRATGDYLGETGLAQFRRGIGSAFDDLDEAGWVFTRRAHGRGIAYEAASAVHVWYEQRWPKPTYCLVPAENPPSFRLADKLGYRKREDIQVMDDVTLMERDHS
ncbi:RimJ/RimL family protein N-acetyltransferase [Rhizobium rhizoryzae]|uniref:RimJ/RimL family protein N-acetyltransferase n=2 Tax=Rhizobium rhizoryzae TaxID=451876 RepID=A0A7W6LKT9_9HYPH|nr:RimJ/RimL family protein N-acetyltransferase [Rhizobium rhizoryzae]